MKIEKVAVLGAGVMGSQIAMQVALHGFKTVCYSRRKETTDHAVSYAENWFKKSIEKGKLTEDAVNETKNRLSFTNDMAEACKDADIVVETVADILDTKRKVLAEADKLTRITRFLPATARIL